jgi:uncharacterized protein (TIRG00374 family)
LRKIRIGITGSMLILGMVILAIYIYLVGFWNIIAVISKLDLRIALAAVAIDILCIGLLTYSWKFLLAGGRLRFPLAYEIILVSMFGDMMIPTGSISGEIMRISMTNKRTGISIGEVTCSVLLHRLLLGVTFGLVLGIAFMILTLFDLASIPMMIILGVIAITSMVTGAFGLFASFNIERFDGLILKWSERIVKVIRFFRRGVEGEMIRAKISEGRTNFQRAICLVRKRNMIASTLVMLARWFLIALIPYLMFLSLGYPVKYEFILIISIFLSMVNLMPIGIPGLVGVMEVAMTAVFVAFGIPADIAASATLLTRLVVFWFELGLATLGASLQGVRGLMSIRGEMEK